MSIDTPGAAVKHDISLYFLNHSTLSQIGQQTQADRAQNLTSNSHPSIDNKTWITTSWNLRVNVSHVKVGIISYYAL